MLAIVIPYYKFTFFEATVVSLSRQYDKRFKVYIGDDASVENPEVLLEKYKGQFDFEYKRFDTNLGVTSLVRQWERCIAMAGDEEWIMILGDDDTLEPNCISGFYEQLEVIEQQKINVIRYATVVIDQNDAPLSGIHMHPQYELSTDFLMRKFRGGTRSSLSEFIFKKKLLQEVKFKDLPLAWYSDILAVLEVSGFGLMYTINEAVVNFRWSGENITSKQDNLVLKNKGSFQFFYYLLDKKIQFFNTEQILVLKGKLEKTFLDNKRNSQFWLQFTKLYWCKMDIRNYLNFVFKAGLMMLNKIKLK